MSSLSEKSRSVDINCDLGEGMPCDADIMPYISSCSIACGGHAGDELSIRSTIALAIQHGLKMGAHPSYPDKENFGRKTLLFSGNELQESLTDQIQTLDALLNEYGIVMHHVKPHGALYNDAARDRGLADLFMATMKATVPLAKLYAPYGSQLSQVALEHDIELVYEVFADRNYNDDLSLVSRALPEALIHDEDASYRHVKRMLLENKVLTIQKSIQAIQADTICVHSDTPEAVAIVAKLHQSLLDDGFSIQ